MATKIQLRRDTSENWETSNPVLSQGEPGLAIDHGRTKIGDGVKAWKDLPYEGDALKITSDNSRFGYHTVTGVKEFEFTTRGHVWAEFVATATTDNGTFTVNVSTYPDIAKHYTLWDDYNNTHIWVNGDYQTVYNVTNITISNNVYTVTLNADPTINSGDRITIMSWSQGTRATWDSKYMDEDWRAYQPTTNSNSVQIDITDSTLYTKLFANPTKSYIVFDDKPVNWVMNNDTAVVQHLVDDARSIKSITQVDGSLCSITFDGPPITVKTDDAGYTITAKSSLTQIDLNYVAVSRTLYPQINEYLYYSGGQVTINGTTRNISSQPSDANNETYEYPNISYYGDNWILHLDGNITCNAGDDLTISWIKPGTEITLIAHDPGRSQGGNFIQWFDWRKDLPFFKASYTNGVTSGRIDWTVKISRPLENTTDSQNSFRPTQDFGNDPVGNYIGGPITVYFDNWTYNRDRWFGESHNNAENSNLFWWYGPEGIFFKEYSYGNRSQTVRVKVAYKMDLFISDDDQYWD